MPLRALLRHLLNNEQLIQKLADSYPIRRAAQLTAYLFHKGKLISEEKLEKFKETDVVNRLQDEMKYSSQKIQDKTNQSLQRTNSFFNTFFKNLNEEWKKAEKKLEEQRKIGGDSKKKY
ncbi:protein NCBP2AS2 homolog [Physella acuta]|uniref:protein NCBP2AS2 homolog n=1 Tax=Physella acuta TaxID=109671 RepID=UPI0027DD6E6E|nr:protein NCBP2AS2 homolog [Physella acuta]